MAAAKYDIVVEQDSDLIRVFQWLDVDGNPIDLTGYGAKFILSENKEKDTGFHLVSSSSTPSIDIEDEDGIVSIRITAEEINTIFEEGISKGYCQLFVYEDIGNEDSQVYRLISGQFITDKSNRPPIVEEES